MATAMGFAQAGFLVLLCLSFCSARRVLSDSTDVEKPNSPSSLPATQSTGTALKSSDGISSLGDSKWQSGCKGNHCSGGGGGANCGGNEGCGGCGNFGGCGCGSGGYYGGCCNSGYGDGCSRGNGGGCDYGCGDGGVGNCQGGYCPPPPTCYPVVSCPPVSTCCPVGCPPGYAHPKVAAEQHLSNLQSPASPKVDKQADQIPDSTPKPDDSDKEKPGLDGQM